MYLHPAKSVLLALVLTVGLCGCGAQEATVSPAPSSAETQAAETPVISQEIAVSSAPETSTEITSAPTQDGEPVICQSPPDSILTYGGAQVTLSGQLSSWSYGQTPGGFETSIETGLEHPLRWENVPVVTPEDATGGLLSFAVTPPDKVTIQWWPTDSEDVTSAALAYDYTTLETLAQQVDVDGEGWFSIPADGPCRVVLTAIWDQLDDRYWGGIALYCFDLMPRA